MKSGAIITADNITSHAEKVKSFVDAIQGNKNYQSEILDLPAGLLVARKIQFFLSPKSLSAKYTTNAVYGNKRAVPHTIFVLQTAKIPAKANIINIKNKIG